MTETAVPAPEPNYVHMVFPEEVLAPLMVWLTERRLVPVPAQDGTLFVHLADEVDLTALDVTRAPADNAAAALVRQRMAEHRRHLGGSDEACT